MGIKCPLCKEQPKIIPINEDVIEEHLIVTRDNNNHYHVHGPIKNKAVIQAFVEFILKESGIAYSVTPGKPAGTDSERKEEGNQQQ